MGKKWKYVWHWCCDWSDPNHGCWNADYEGRCTSGSRRGLDSEEKAEKAALQHKQKNYEHTTHTWRERKYFD